MVWGIITAGITLYSLLTLVLKALWTKRSS